MTLTLDFSQQEEERLTAAARQQGVDPAELARQLVTENLPPLPIEEVDSQNAAAISLLQSWLHDEKTDDQVLIHRAEEELEEFKQRLNANRAETGERLLFP